jgi:nucleoside-diphosphate-sugar epimerase
MNRAARKPVVLITGAAGNIGSALVEALAPDYTVVGLDRPGASAAIPLIPVDLASDESVERAMQQFRARFGARIASVIHLAAYFDFTGTSRPSAFAAARFSAAMRDGTGTSCSRRCHPVRRDNAQTRQSQLLSD